MKIKFKITENSYDLNFKAKMFSKLENEYKELELELYENIFVHGSELDPKYLVEIIQGANFFHFLAMKFSFMISRSSHATKNSNLKILSGVARSSNV